MVNVVMVSDLVNGWKMQFFLLLIIDAITILGWKIQYTTRENGDGECGDA